MPSHSNFYSVTTMDFFFLLFIFREELRVLYFSTGGGSMTHFFVPEGKFYFSSLLGLLFFSWIFTFVGILDFSRFFSLVESSGRPKVLSCSYAYIFLRYIPLASILIPNILGNAFLSNCCIWYCFQTFGASNSSVVLPYHHLPQFGFPSVLEKVHIYSQILFNVLLTIVIFIIVF